VHGTCADKDACLTFSVRLPARCPALPCPACSMEEEFGRLMKDITRSLDGMNRDRFQNRITLFRLACKEFAKAS